MKVRTLWHSSQTIYTVPAFSLHKFLFCLQCHYTRLQINTIYPEIISTGNHARFRLLPENKPGFMETYWRRKLFFSSPTKRLRHDDKLTTIVVETHALNLAETPKSLHAVVKIVVTWPWVNSHMIMITISFLRYAGFLQFVFYFFSIYYQSALHLQICGALANLRAAIKDWISANYGDGYWKGVNAHSFIQYVVFTIKCGVVNKIWRCRQISFEICDFIVFILWSLAKLHVLCK